MYHLSLGAILLVGFLANMISASPVNARTQGFNVEEEITKLNITHRLSELPKGTVYQYKYFDYGHGPASSSYDVVVSLDNAVTCGTTDGAPQALTYDVVKTLETIKKLPENSPFCQKSFSNLKCTILAEEGTASLSLCSRYQSCLLPEDILDFLVLIIDNCQEGDKVNGKINLLDIPSSSEEGSIAINYF